LSTKDFTWTSSINLTVPKTLLTDYPKQDLLSDYYSLRVGKPLGILFVYHYLGVDPATGVYQFADKNGNPTTTPNDPDDKTEQINISPKFYGGFQNTFIFKGFQLDVLFSFTKQLGANYLLGNGVLPPGYFQFGLNNQLAKALNRWQKPGDTAPFQRFSSGFDLFTSQDNAFNSDMVWTDASYIRLKNVSLTWQFPRDWSKGMNLRDCGLFIQGQNLLTLTSYNGLDPETKSSTTLPPLRVITLGVKIGL